MPPTTARSETISTRALWYDGQGGVSIRQDSAVTPRDGACLVRTLFSSVSRGTERLVLEGRVPESEWRRMRAPRQEGNFPGPVKYGYAAVGTVENGPPALIGRHVFCLNPHETAFVADPDALCLLPEGAPIKRMTLAANMETALNAVWDSGAGPCDRVAVVGGGVVGLLALSLLAGMPGVEATLIDHNPRRAGIAAALGARFAPPEGAPTDLDVVLHASASAAGLATALSLAGEEATVVEMSWHGSGDVAIPLGGAFHARRLKLVSSQVGQVSASRRPRWSHRRRLEAAIALLGADERLDALLDAEIAFDDAPAKLPGLLASDSDAVGIVIAYS